MRLFEIVLVIGVIITMEVISAKSVSDKTEQVIDSLCKKAENKHSHDGETDDSSEDDSSEENSSNETKQKEQLNSSSNSDDSDSNESDLDEDSKKQDFMKCMQTQPALFRCFFDETQDNKQERPKYFSNTIISDKPWPSKFEDVKITTHNNTMEEAGTLYNWVKFRLKNRPTPKYFNFKKSKDETCF